MNSLSNYRPLYYWYKYNGSLKNIPPGTVQVSETYLVAKAVFHNQQIPGKFQISTGKTYIPWGNKEHEVSTDVELLVVPEDSVYEWVPARDGKIPEGTVGPFGFDQLYVGKGNCPLKERGEIPGKIHPANKRFYCAWLNKEHESAEYYALVVKPREFPLSDEEDTQSEMDTSMKTQFKLMKAKTVDLAKKLEKANEMVDNGKKSSTKRITMWKQLEDINTKNHVLIKMDVTNKCESLEVNEEFMKAYKSIRGLELNFCYIDSVDSHYMPTVLKQNLELLSELRSLDLTFAKSVKLSGEQFSSILKSVATLKNLKTLKLNLQGCTITDIELEELASVLIWNENKELTNLNITIGEDSSISDSGLILLSRAVEMLLDLKFFKFAQSGTLKITDEGLITLIYSIGKLSELEALNLTFAQCINLSEKPLALLQETLSKASDLSFLNLNLGSSQDQLYQAGKVIEQKILKS
jgi:hypothetical protein